MTKPQNVIIVGLGAMGSSTVMHLAKRGHHVIGFDRNPPNHDLGSSHGRTRIFRQVYFEDSRYVPLLKRARELWLRLQQDSGITLFHSARLLTIGMPSGTLVERTLKSAGQPGTTEPKILTATQVRKCWPVFSVSEGAEAVLEEDAGYLEPKACISAQQKMAKGFGAKLHFNDPILSWAAGKGKVSVTTTQGTLTADRLVIAAGPWATELLSSVGAPLKVLRQVTCWLRPTDPKPFQEIPMFIFEAEKHCPMVYGFPLLGSAKDGVKVALHGTEAIEGITAECNPDTVDRVVSLVDESNLRDRLATTVPELAAAERVHAETCLYTMTPDENFMLSQHPEHPEVVVAAGFSGHGFKFASVVGEIVATLVWGEKPPFGLGFLKVGRDFDGN